MVTSKHKIDKFNKIKYNKYVLKNPIERGTANMVLRFKREDEEFGVVEIELLTDDVTGHLIRLRRKYFVSGYKAKQDFYKDATPETFKRELEKETNYLSNLLLSILEMKKQDEILESFEKVSNERSNNIEKLLNGSLED